MAGDGSDPKAVAADESEVKTLTAAQLSARLSKMDKDAQKLLVSLLYDAQHPSRWWCTRLDGNCNPSTSPLVLVVL